MGQGGTPRQALHAAKNARFKEIPKVEYVASTNSYSLPPIIAGVRAALPKNQEIYIVGGAVRDLLLGQPLRELDFALAGKAIPLGRRVAKALSADFFPLDEKNNLWYCRTCKLLQIPYFFPKLHIWSTAFD